LVASDQNTQVGNKYIRKTNGENLYAIANLRD
jgi:hypothetical protein